MENKMKPYGTAFVSGFGAGMGNRVIFNPHKFIKGKNKGKIQCYIRKGSKFKKIILDESDITKMDF